MLRTFLIGCLGVAFTLSAQSATTVAGLTFRAPSAWESVPPTSRMRAAQWKIAPARKKESAGEVVVFYFGKDQGGDAASNVQRWLRTMSTPEGGKVEGEVKERSVAGLKVTEVVAYGTYASGTPMPGVPPVPEPGYGLAGVVIEGSQGNIFIRLTGPEALVKAQLASFRQFVNSAKPE